MSKLQREILTLPKMRGSVSNPKLLSGNIGAKTINIGEKGDDGGYYAPAVTQPDTNTMRFSFTPSKAGMPAVSDTDITISSGGSCSVAVDSTLTVSGQAADAKVTGDALRSLSDEIDNLGGSVDVYVEPAEDDIPKVFFGGALQQTKDAAVVPFRYISKTQDISGYAEIKAQGNSSMSYPKKNQTVKLFKDANCTEKLKVDFKGWGMQNKHVYKANWIDLSHARNVVSARLWADVVKSRAGYENLPELLRTSPNQGAVDGFPVKVYAAGVYQGRYTLNIPKDKWMVNMDDALDTHCILCGENYVSGCFRAAASINGSDWTDEIHDTVPDAIKTRWNEVISFVMNSTDDEFVAGLGNYFYVDSLIDYHLFGLASCGLDAYGKNQLYLTYDGQKWIADMYDMDSTWGLYWNGSSFVATDYARTSYEDYVNGQGNLLYVRLEQLFYEELQSRWAELKAGALSIENIINRFERFTDITPVELVKEDYATTTGGGAFIGIPSQSTNNIQQIRSYALSRQAWCDEYIAGLTSEEVPCTGISLSAETLTFTGTGTQTLTATVEPDGCTDTVTWESSDTSIATVSGGVITAVGNGDCVITATCGEQSATCNVVVSGIESGGGDIGSENLLYNLPETTVFVGTSYIDTKVDLNQYSEYTVMLDVSGVNAEKANNTLFDNMTEQSPYPGWAIDVTYSFGYRFASKIQYSGICTETAGRNKIVVRRSADGELTLFTDSVFPSGISMTSKVASGSVNHTVYLGAYYNNGSVDRYAEGTMHDCKIYSVALSDDEITAYLNS